MLVLRTTVLAVMVIAGAPFCFLNAQILTAECRIHAKDVYGQPASGILVTLTGYLPTQQELDEPMTSIMSYTDMNGNADFNLPNDSYTRVNCATTSAAGGYTPFQSELVIFSPDENGLLSGELIVVPKPEPSLPVGNGDMDLYRSGSYDKPIVIAQPFFTDEPISGRKTAAQLWRDYNGNSALLSQGVLELLFSKGYDVWLFRPKSAGDDIHLQAQDFAMAVQQAARFNSYNGKVAVAGYSMGGLVVRAAVSRWDWDADWRRLFGLDFPLPINLIVALDSPLRGALVNNDLQHAFWNATFDDGGQTAKDHNMDSCAAQQMLENACHKSLDLSLECMLGKCLECNDRGWYATFYSGGSFAYCSPAGSSGCIPNTVNTGVKICTNASFGILTQPNGGWPAGIRKIGASLGKWFESTGVCYGDAVNDLRDKRGDMSDGCPAADSKTFLANTYLGTNVVKTEWGYIDISLSTNRVFYYQALDDDFSADAGRQHRIDELTPGSRQPGSVEEVTKSILGFKIANGHQLLHAGTFIPLYSALDQDPSTKAIPFDEYWTNSYSAFHDALSDKVQPAGTWVNQRTSQSGSLSLPQWLVKNLDGAFNPPLFVLAVGRTGTGVGTVVSSPTGISCGATCNSSFAAGVVVALTASAAPGSTFAGWSGTVCSGAGPCTVTMNTAQSVTATFNTVSSGCGEASCVPAQAAYISHFTGSGCTGTESYYLPYDGYAYNCRPWDGTGQCGTIHRTVTNTSYKYNGICTNAWPSGNTLSDFVTVYRGSSGPVSFALSVGRAGTGTGTVVSSPAGISCGGTCSSSFAAGTVVTLTASAGTGSTFAGWSGAGCSGAGACTITVNAAQSVTATFNAATTGGCGEASCVPAQAAYISHFTGAGCTGTESYYLPYDGYAYSCRTWNGTGQCGTIHRTVTNRSYKYNGVCSDAWPGGNTLSDFVTVYR